MKKIGSCHCGSIEIKSNYAPMLINQCNCTSCRKLYSVLSVTGIFSQEEIEVSGDLKNIPTTEGAEEILSYFFVLTAPRKPSTVLRLLKG